MRFLVRTTVAAAVLAVAGSAGVVAAQPAAAFGTINGAGQRAEHERLTRAALHCPGGRATSFASACFEPWSLDQLAGKRGSFGGVGSPDGGPEALVPAAHCDNGDFLAVPGYPRTREQGKDALVACLRHLRDRFHKGQGYAADVVSPSGEILDDGSVPVVGKIPCVMNDVKGRAKCNVIEQFGRELHGLQDFYAHSNWTDAGPAGPGSVADPPGLSRTGPVRFDLTGAPATRADVPEGVITGCFTLAGSACDNRVTHDVLNKDNGLIDPVTGATSDPTTDRGRRGGNFDRAVQAAVGETRFQWERFRSSLQARYGWERAARMICVVTHDDPKDDCTGTPPPAPGPGAPLPDLLAVPPALPDRLRPVRG